MRGRRTGEERECGEGEVTLEALADPQKIFMSSFRLHSVCASFVLETKQCASYMPLSLF